MDIYTAQFLLPTDERRISEIYQNDNQFYFQQIEYINTFQQVSDPG